MKIAFITDGGSEKGMGHVQQSTTLAEELRDRGEICFLTKSDETVVKQIRNLGFNTFKLNNDDEMLDLLHEIRPNIVIIDKLDVAESLAKNLKETLRAKLVIFTNLTLANRYADIAVSAVIGSNFKNSKFLDQKTNTLYFYGPKYWVLRKEFYELKKKGKRLTDKVEKILLIFGGSDYSNLTSIALSELLRLDNDYKIDVIVGAHFEHFDALNQVFAQYPNKKESLNLYRNINNVAELMYSADLVIASPGLSVFEALCVGTPVVVGHQNQFQKDGFKGFVPTLGKEDMNRLGDVLTSAAFVDPRQENITRLEIGEGKTELIETIIGG